MRKTCASTVLGERIAELIFSLSASLEKKECFVRFAKQQHSLCVENMHLKDEQLLLAVSPTGHHHTYNTSITAISSLMLIDKQAEIV